MRVLRHKNDNLFTIETRTRDLAYRLSLYGENSGYWFIESSIYSDKRLLHKVYCVDVAVIEDDSLKTICEIMDMRLFGVSEQKV